MTPRRWWIAGGLTMAVAAAALYAVMAPLQMPHTAPPKRSAATPPSPVSRPAFDRWLNAIPARQAEFAAFTAFLEREGVADVLPVWTLTRSDRRSSSRCRFDAFILPPRAAWGAMVPTLRLIRDDVLPVVGEVEVASAYREPASNVCAGGARESRHMRFAALDLEPRNDQSVDQNFRALCAAWRRAGPSSRWGLGAYYNADDPRQHRRGRFHVDATGWRTWGYSKSSASSGCHVL